MEKVHNIGKMKRAVSLFGATLAFGGFMALTSPLEAHASEWDERAVTDIQTDIQNSNSVEYQIQWGDTLGNIAQALDMPLNTLANANGIANMNYIVAGQILTISENAEGQTVVEVQEEQAPVQEPVQEVAQEPVVEVAPEPVAEPVQEVHAEAPAPETNLSTSEAEAKEIIAQRESGGSYTAVNGQYYGRYQLNPSLVQHGASPAEQEEAAQRYINSRYGSWNKALEFWNANGFY